eukprot:351639-Chlamydomonas_euryale.AAC.1
MGALPPTHLSFHSRCIPPLMRSFMMSYDDATLVNTCSTIDCLSDRGTSLKPARAKHMHTTHKAWSKYNARACAQLRGMLPAVHISGAKPRTAGTHAQHVRPYCCVCSVRSMHGCVGECLHAAQANELVRGLACLHEHDLNTAAGSMPRVQGGPRAAAFAMRLAKAHCSIRVGAQTARQAGLSSLGPHLK